MPPPFVALLPSKVLSVTVTVVVFCVLTAPPCSPLTRLLHPCTCAGAVPKCSQCGRSTSKDKVWQLPTKCMWCPVSTCKADTLQAHRQTTEAKASKASVAGLHCNIVSDLGPRVAIEYGVVDLKRASLKADGPCLGACVVDEGALLKDQIGICCQDSPCRIIAQPSGMHSRPDCMHAP